MKDKALIKTLVQRTDELSERFEEQVMSRILAEREKKSRRDYYLSLLLAGAVSLVLIGGAVFVLEYFFSFNLLHLFSNTRRIRFEYNPLYTGCFFIAVLILLLLALDHQFRKIMKKMGYN